MASSVWLARAQESAKSPPTGGSRIPWLSSRVIGSPEPPPPYQVERVFPQVKFNNPVDLCAAPGTDRLFTAVQAGKVYSFKNEPSATSPDLVIDLSRSIPGVNALYGIAFHPGFATNHFLFVCYVLKDGLPDGSRVSRFTLSDTDPPRADPATEKVLITWFSGGHNGGCLKFGPDGCLYISTGDGGNPNPPDPFQTGQDTSDLLSSILRIDVDHPPAGKPYRIPEDNPFFNREGSRPEVWAYGLRNPWRMSFDRATGALWVADVGWELWEMVYRVERGGNYGWSIVEGPQSVHPDGKRGPTPILPPVKAHPHTEAASITGGFVYHGRRLKELVGAYIYGDWVTGKIWALRIPQPGAAVVRELVTSPLQVVCFGEELSGELLVVDYGGGIYRLAPNTSTPTLPAFPRRLSETGLFASTANHELAAGVRPFAINAEMWADGALTRRFIGLPGDSSIQTGASNDLNNTSAIQTKNNWRYPTNSVLGKTLALEMVKGRPETLRRIETQMLHFDGLTWHAYSYRWNDSQSDAVLVEAPGDEATFEIRDPAAPNGHRQQSWRFHSRSECLRCHNPWVNVALAFTAPQLNRKAELTRNFSAKSDSEPRPTPGGNPHLSTDQQPRCCRRRIISINAWTNAPDPSSPTRTMKRRT